MSDIEIGRAKRARRAYAFDDIAIVPSRRTRDPHDVSVSWTIDAFTFDIPVIAAPMDSVVSPDVAIAMGRFGGLGVLDLEGLWTRYDDPEPVLAEIRELPADAATRRMPELYSAPIQPELIKERLAQIRAAAFPSPEHSARSARRSSTRRLSTPVLTSSSSAALPSALSTSPSRPSR